MDPCSWSIVLFFTGDILDIKNATSFQFNDSIPSLPIEIVADSVRFGVLRIYSDFWDLEITSTAEANITIAGQGNCPTNRKFEKGLYWQGMVTRNQSKQLFCAPRWGVLKLIFVQLNLLVWVILFIGLK